MEMEEEKEGEEKKRTWIEDKIEEEEEKQHKKRRKMEEIIEAKEEEEMREKEEDNTVRIKEGEEDERKRNQGEMETINDNEDLKKEKKKDDKEGKEEEEENKNEEKVKRGRIEKNGKEEERENQYKGEEVEEDVNSNTNTHTQTPPLSKRQLKKQLKRARWLETKDERKRLKRQREKEKAKARKQQWEQNTLENSTQPSLALDTENKHLWSQNETRTSLNQLSLASVTEQEQLGSQNKTLQNSAQPTPTSLALTQSADKGKHTDGNQLSVTSNTCVLLENQCKQMDGKQRLTSQTPETALQPSITLSNSSLGSSAALQTQTLAPELSSNPGSASSSSAVALQQNDATERSSVPTQFHSKHCKQSTGCSQTLGKEIQPMVVSVNPSTIPETQNMALTPMSVPHQNNIAESDQAPTVTQTIEHPSQPSVAPVSPWSGPMSRRFLKKHSVKMVASTCKLRVAVDLSLECLMDDRRLGQCLRQVARCYSANRRVPAPLQMFVTSFCGRPKEFMELQAGYENWDVNFCAGSYLETFEHHDIIYLTSESSYTLDHLDHSKVYIIGGLVDHNKLKGHCLKLAQDHGLATARLPIDRYLDMLTRKVLTIDQVFRILLGVAGEGRWRDVLLSVLPPRKGAKGKEEEEEEEEEEVEKERMKE